MTKVICVVGLTAAGKTTIVKTIAQMKGYPMFSVGTLEREIAAKKGYSDIVIYEKVIGIQDAYMSLFPAVVEDLKRLISKTKVIVIEGIYSPHLLEMIENVFGKENISLINIACTRHTRLRRYAARERLTIKDAKNNFRQLEKNKCEAGVNEILKSRNTFLIRNTGTLAGTLQQIDERLSDI
jgi:dephospho-CoA kinase